MRKTFLTPVPREIWYVLTAVCLQMSRKARVTCNFNCFIET